MPDMYCIARELFDYQMDNEDILECNLTKKDSIQAQLDKFTDWDVEDFDDYKELKKMMVQTVKLADDIRENHLYRGDHGSYIQLSDNRTLWDINITDDFDDEDYSFVVNQFAEKFEAETGVKVYLLGRSGRHICVDISYENALQFDELCKVQRRYEKELIKMFSGDE